MTLTVSSLHVYPVKSVAGLSLDTVEVRPRGLAGDRRYVIVDEQGKFITARENPALLSISAALHADGVWLTLSASGHAPVTAMPDPSIAAEGWRMPITVWGDSINALPVSGPVNQWLSGLLGQTVILYYMDEEAARPIAGEPGHEVSFADGYPLLVVSEASLADLNAKLGEDLAMARFRPNLVVSGCDAFAEEAWNVMTIGHVTLKITTRCERCVLTTRDPNTGVRHPASEPLRTLATYRRNDAGKACFGMNAIVLKGGTVSVGEDVALSSA